MVEKYYDGAASRQADSVRYCRIKFIRIGLPGCQDGVFDALVCQDRQNFIIDCSFWEPHPTRGMTEAVVKICDPPCDLNDLVRRSSQGQNRVVVSLGEGITNAVLLIIGSILIQNLLVGMWILPLQPGKQCRTDIKTDLFEIMEARIWLVALIQDAFIPVFVRRSAGFLGNDAG